MRSNQNCGGCNETSSSVRPSSSSSPNRCSNGREERHLAAFPVLIGTWKGTGKGEPGNSDLERVYELVLSNKFINVKHKSSYQPQQRNPKGETHEDWGYISFDRVRKVYVLRQFHVEGFVTQYYAQTLTPDGKTMVFLSENLENLPAGFRARETYKILNENEFVEIFELAPPGKEFSVYSENLFKRVQ